MKKSFKNAPAEDDGAVAVADEEALAEVNGSELPVPAGTNVVLSLGEVSGDIDRRDLILPRLNIVQGVGPMSELFDSGDIVLNGETLIVPKETPVQLTVLSIKKSFEEWLAYDPDGPRPRLFETVESLQEADLWTDWRNNERPPAREIATAMLLINKPEELESVSFSTKVGEKDCAVAVWTIRGSAYARAAKKIFSAASLELARTGLLSGLWELSTKKESVNGNPIAVPVLMLKGRNSEETVKSITEALA